MPVNINLQNIPSILSYGFIGFGFLLALLTFVLLIKIINNPHHRNTSVLLVLVFMFFSLTMAGGGIYIEVVSKNNSEAMIELMGRLEKLEAEKSRLSNSLDSTKESLVAANKEISKMKSRPFNWTYKANSHMFQCYVDGELIGAELNCKEHGSCSNFQLNRGICALRYSGLVFK